MQFRSLKIAFCIAISLVLPAGSAAIAKAELIKSTPRKTFKIGNRLLYGTDQNKVCVINGKWSDGTSFHYRAWDRCVKMVIYHAKAREVKGSVSLVGDEPGVKDIPKTAEVLHADNGISIVLIFRDQKDVLRTITTGD